MNQLLKTWQTQQDFSSRFDSDMTNYEYIDQILQYIQIARLDQDDLVNVLPFFYRFVADAAKLPQSEKMFVGLCAAFRVRPDEYLSYITGRTIEDLAEAKECACRYASKLEL